MEHFGINLGKKHKGQDDVNKPAKSHAALANLNPNTLKGKAK